MPMTDMAGVMDAIATAITDAGVTGRVYAYPAGAVSPPCAVVGYPETIDFDMSFVRGADEATFPVYFIVGKVVERAARDKLSTIVAGAAGIKGALEKEPFLDGSAQTLRVTDMKVQTVTISAIDYLSAKFSVEVIV